MTKLANSEAFYIFRPKSIFHILKMKLLCSNWMMAENSQSDNNISIRNLKKLLADPYKSGELLESIDCSLKIFELLSADQVNILPPPPKKKTQIPRKMFDDSDWLKNRK